jgi:hypothetical protein
MKSWKIDLWIAFGALAVSALTASAAIYQSNVFSDQLSATVWPYLAFDRTMTNTSGGKGRAVQSRLVLTVVNDGEGPAIVERVRIDARDRPEPSVDSALRALKLVDSGTRSYSWSSIDPGQVIRAGGVANVFGVSTSSTPQAVNAAARLLEIEIDYCSLLNRCWRVRWHAAGRPKAIPAPT